MEIITSILIVCVIFFGDLWIKNKIEKSGIKSKGGTGGESAALFGGRILLRNHHNKGFILNCGQGRRRAVAVLSMILSVLMGGLFVLSLGRRGNKLLRVGLAFLLGGAFSNTYDRLKRQYVVDYFSFNVKWKRLRGIVFNLSDFCIIIGSMLMVIGAC